MILLAGYDSSDLASAKRAHELPSTVPLAATALNRYFGNIPVRNAIKGSHLNLQTPAIAQLSHLGLHITTSTTHSTYHIHHRIPLIPARHVFVTSQVKPRQLLRVYGSYQGPDTHTTPALPVRPRSTDTLPQPISTEATIASGFTALKPTRHTDATVPTATDGLVRLCIIHILRIFGLEFSGYLHALPAG